MTKRKSGSDEKAPQTFDGQTGRPDPPPRRIDLSSLRDVRLELASLYRKVDTGEMDSTEGNKRAWLLRQICDVTIASELERRIGELEERQLLSGGIPALPYRPQAH